MISSSYSYKLRSNKQTAQQERLSVWQRHRIMPTVTIVEDGLATSLAQAYMNMPAGMKHFHIIALDLAGWSGCCLNAAFD